MEQKVLSKELHSFTANSEHPPFWNVSGVLHYYINVLTRRQSKQQGKAAPIDKVIVARKSLERAWDNAAGSSTPEEALKNYRIVAELLASEVGRIQSVKGPGRPLLLYPLRQQQVECANNILRLCDVIRRNEKITLPF